MHRIILSLVLLVAAAQAGAGEPHFLSYPSLAPDGTRVVFSFEGDLWKADLASGKAMRLTAMQGYETGARWSPDGKWILFAGRQYGNADLYIIPAEGGDIRQLTFHAANDEPECWSWDSKEIWFRSNRQNNSSIYRIPLEGGNPVRVFPHYFNTLHNVALHPLTGEVFFNDTGESLNMTWRKRYRGAYDPDIQSYNPKTGEHRIYTTWDGKDMWATIDRNGKVYFVSDEENGQYNLCRLEEGKPEQLTRFSTSVVRPSVSADGNLVVFEKDYRLWIYDTGTRESRALNLTMVSNTLLPADQSFQVNAKISAFDVSPDNKKIAFVSRGDLFAGDIDGKFVRRIERSGESGFERVKQVKWLADNKTLIFNQSLNGYSNWYTIAADGSGEMKQVTAETRHNRDLVLSRDRTKAAYISGRDELRLLDLKTMKSTLLVQDEFWGFQNGDPDFSPDGKWLLFTAKRDFEDDLFVINLESREIMNLTQTGVSESGARWSGDGKYIYLTTNRLKPSYPGGAGDVHIYRVALDRYDPEYRAERFEKLFVKDSAGAKKDSLKPVIINPDRIWERYQLISPSFGSQSSPFVLRKGDKETLLYFSNHDKGTQALWKTVIEPFEQPKTEKIEGLTARSGLVACGDKVYALSGGNIFKVNLEAKKADKVEINLAFTRNLEQEFRQMFEETWANVEENFYHEELNREDWPAHREHYARFLPLLNNRNDLRTLLNDMLGELNSSHMGFNTTGTEEAPPLTYVTLETGILFEDDDPFMVKRVVKRGPADRAGIDIRPGDRLTKVNGVPTDPARPRDFYFYRPALEPEMTLAFKRDKSELETRLHPVVSGAMNGYLYDEWIDENRSRVEALSGGKIAYAYMKNMGGGELNEFIMTMTRELKGKEGLILDLRYNTGGNVHDEVLRFLQQRTYLQWKSRGGRLSNQSNFAPSDHPIVLLINEQSLSDAEMTAAGFRELKLGTIIGTETYRWIIFTSSMGLVDGSSHRMPGWGCYTLDGRDLEKEGVAPDIEVPMTFTDRLSGKDPQIERAVREVLREVTER